MTFEMVAQDNQEAVTVTQPLVPCLEAINPSGFIKKKGTVRTPSPFVQPFQPAPPRFDSLRRPAFRARPRLTPSALAFTLALPGTGLYRPEDRSPRYFLTLGNVHPQWQSGCSPLRVRAAHLCLAMARRSCPRALPARPLAPPSFRDLRPPFAFAPFRFPVLPSRGTRWLGSACCPLTTLGVWSRPGQSGHGFRGLRISAATI